MTAPLDDLYLEWLYSQVASVKARAKTKTYWNLMRQLYRKEFVYFVPNDDNRANDGRDLRLRFMEASDISEVDPNWLRLPCSMLELIIGMAYSLEFESDAPMQMWFWKMIENLELEQCTDARYSEAMDAWVDSILDRVIWRTYDGKGRGGLFPLQDSSKDQREVELWYQLSAYLLEYN